MTERRHSQVSPPGVPDGFVPTSCGERARRLEAAGAQVVYEPPKARRVGRYWYPHWIGLVLYQAEVCGLPVCIAYRALTRALTSDAARETLVQIAADHDSEAIKAFAKEAP